MSRRSAQCKLQQRLLGSVGELCEKLAVPSQQFEPLAVAALPYLSDSQPAWLQETCVTSLTTLIQLDADLMWLLLQSLQPEATTTPPPGPAFKPYKVLVYYTLCEVSLKNECLYVSLRVLSLSRFHVSPTVGSTARTFNLSLSSHLGPSNTSAMYDMHLH